MLTSPSWPPVMNAANGLIDWTTSPDRGSLNTGMRGSSILSAPRRGDCSGGEDAQRGEGGKRDGVGGEKRIVARMKRSEIRVGTQAETPIPDCASLHPGYVSSRVSNCASLNPR